MTEADPRPELVREQDDYVGILPGPDDPQLEVLANPAT